MASTSEQFIGFPTPLLGMDPLRLPVLFDEGDLLALAKPEGIGVLQDNWYPKTPLLVEAIRHQAQAGKPELQRLKIPSDGLIATHDLDPELAGPVLFARSEEKAEAIKNAIGSLEVEFEFHILCAQAPVGAEHLMCNLPLARHFNQKRVVVSSQTGKKSETVFTLLDRMGSHSLWSAKTRYLRRHQIFIHATEVGLKVVGDKRYARENHLYLSQIKPGYRSKKNVDERPLYESPSAFLSSITLPDESKVLMEAPSRFATQLKYLHQFGSKKRF